MKASTVDTIFGWAIFCLMFFLIGALFGSHITAKLHCEPFGYRKDYDGRIICTVTTDIEVKP